MTPLCRTPTFVIATLRSPETYRITLHLTKQKCTRPSSTTCSSVLAPSEAALCALVERRHRLVGRADLQLLVVSAPIGALWAICVCLVRVLPGFCSAKHLVHRLMLQRHLAADLQTVSQQNESNAKKDILAAVRTVALSWNTYGHVWQQKRRFPSTFCAQQGMS